MVRKLIILATVLLAAMPLKAEDNNILRHLSLSAGIGTTGITAEVGTMVTNYIGIRGGVDYMPKFKYSTDLNLSHIYQGEIPEEYEGIDISDITTKVAVQGQLHNSTAHALLDIYPFSGAGFHLTVGAYFAQKDRFVTVCNKEEGALRIISDFNARRGGFADIPLSYGQVAAKLGDYNIMPDDQGNANAYVKVKKVRPYVGIGFGRTVPKSLDCEFDLGVQMLGKPRFYDGVSGEELTSDGAKGDDGGLLKDLSKITVYPVLSIRLVGRIF